MQLKRKVQIPRADVGLPKKIYNQYNSCIEILLYNWMPNSEIYAGGVQDHCPTVPLCTPLLQSLKIVVSFVEEKPQVLTDMFFCGNNMEPNFCARSKVCG